MRRVKPQPSPEQAVLPPYQAQLVTEMLYPEIDPERRISLVSLASLVGANVRFGREPRRKDYDHATPDSINRGLYIAPIDEGYDKAHHVARLGNWNGRGRNSEPLGVVFPPHEFYVVARSSKDLGRHSVNKTRRAHWSDTDRDGAKQASMRSAAHILTARIESQTKLVARLEDERNILRSLLEHLYSPSAVRIPARKLKGQLMLTDEKIHETAEIASILLDFDNAAILGLHRVIRKKIYNGNYSNAERAHNLIDYVKMVGVHTLRKIEKLELSKTQCKEELKIYQPFIDAKEAREREQQQAA